MVKFCGLNVTINVDGVPLPEFDVPLDAQPANLKKGNFIMRYIEAETGKAFTIEQSGDTRTAELQGSQGVNLDVFIDGKYAHDLMSHRDEDFTASIKGRIYGENGEIYEVPVIFNTLDNNHGVEITKIKGHELEKLGLIEVIARRFFSYTKSTHNETQDPNSDFLKEKHSIHETQLKGAATTLTTTYGEAEKVSYDVFDLDFKDPEEEPYARFLFFYRSRTSLQSLGVVPRDRAPTPDLPLEERDPDDLDLHDAIALVKSLKEDKKKLEQTVSKIEHFRRMLNLEIGVGIKREAPEEDDDQEIPSIQTERPAKRRQIISLDD